MAEVATLAEPRIDDARLAAIDIDAHPYAGNILVVAQGITAFGTKRLLNPRSGATPNATVITSRLEELRMTVRGLTCPSYLVRGG